MAAPVPRARRAGARRAVFVILVAALAGAPASAEQVFDGIAAQVGSEIVLISDVEQVAAPALRGLRAEGASQADVARLKGEVLEHLIERALVRKVVRRAELQASEREIDEAIRAIAAENDLSLEALRESVESQGLPYEAYRQRIREEIEHSKVMNGMVGSRVRIEESEIRELYEEQYSDQPEGGEEIRLRHILVSADPEEPGSMQRACQQVRDAEARVRAGEPFTEVAGDVSEVNPRQGGELGWVHYRYLAEWMRPIVDEMEPGDLSGVVEMRFGCNLMQLVDRRPFEQIAYEEVRDRLRRHLFNQRMDEEYRSFIDELRENTYIERKGVFAGGSPRGDAGPADPPERF